MASAAGAVTGGGPASAAGSASPSTVGNEELRDEYDGTVQQLLMQFKALEPTHPQLVANMKAGIQQLYTLFAQANHKLHSRCVYPGGAQAGGGPGCGSAVQCSAQSPSPTSLLLPGICS